MKLPAFQKENIICNGSFSKPFSGKKLLPVIIRYPSRLRGRFALSGWIKFGNNETTLWAER